MPHTECAYRELIESGLRDYLPESRLRCADRLNDAVDAAVFPGGKRTRPLLTLLAAKASGGCERAAVPAACAIEYLHTSSLIFDDLPAMDDAALRRGGASLHVSHGEDVALLAALSLLNQAYALFGRWPLLLSEAVEAIGENGMIGGQAVDLTTRLGHSSDALSFAAFSARNRKTSALMRLTFVAGALATGASGDAVEALASAGECLGEAYQICDDLSDAYLDAGATHATAFSADACQAHAAELVTHAVESIYRQFGAASEPLIGQIELIAADFRRAGLVAA